MITPDRKGRIPENREVVQGRLIEMGQMGIRRSGLAGASISGIVEIYYGARGSGPTMEESCP